jgi:hypothetical protein
MTKRRLNEDYAPERDNRSFNEKYGKKDVFNEAELGEVIPESVRKLFENVLTTSKKTKLQESSNNDLFKKILNS